MKIILYLSGKRLSENWHNTRDSIVGSVTIPRKCMAAWNEQVEYNEIGIHTGEDQLRWDHAEIIHDVFEDIKDDPENPLNAIADEVIALCESEACCGYIHFGK